MSTVEVVKNSTKERIKEIADEECLKSFNGKCCTPKGRISFFKPSVNRPYCWMCHKHDALAERIAEEVGK